MRVRLMLAVAFAAAAQFITAPTARADTWTVMVYMASDNDLEPFAPPNVAEMARVSGANLTVVLQADRFGAHDETPFLGAEPYQGVRRYEVGAEGATLVEDLGTVDMTDPATIADFEAWGFANYPADHYALIMWDHGGAWQGANEDANGGRSITPASELVDGIAAGMPTDVYFDIIGFDECLMANFEVVQALAPLADVIVASEETEAGSGWDYEPFLRAIVDDPLVTADIVGAAIADGFAAKQQAAGDPTYTLSVIGAVDFEMNTTPAIGALATALVAGLADEAIADEIARARASADAFGRSPQSDGPEVVDLGQMAQHLVGSPVLAGTSEGASIQTAAQGLLDALTTSMLYTVSGAQHGGALGLSVYLPAQAQDPGYNDAAVPFGANTEWPSFVAAYSSRMTSDTTAPDVTDLSVGADGTLNATTVGDDIDDVDVVLVRDDAAGLVFVGSIPTTEGGGADDTFDGGAVGFSWVGTWPFITDGTASDEAPMFAVDVWNDGTGDHATMAVFAEVDTGDGLGYESAVLYFDMDLATRFGEFIGAWQYDDSGAGELDLSSPDASVRTSQVIVTASGDYLVQPGTTDLRPASLALAPIALTDGNYELGLSVTDVAGNTVTEFVAVTAADGVIVPGRGGPGPGPGPDSGGCTVGEARQGAGTATLGTLLGAVCVVLARRRGTRASLGNSNGARR